jgi:hypothetical protein
MRHLAIIMLRRRCVQRISCCGRLCGPLAAIAGGTAKNGKLSYQQAQSAVLSRAALPPSPAAFLGGLWRLGRPYCASRRIRPSDDRMRLAFPLTNSEGGRSSPFNSNMWSPRLDAAPRRRAYCYTDRAARWSNRQTRPRGLRGPRQISRRTVRSNGYRKREKGGQGGGYPGPSRLSSCHRAICVGPTNTTSQKRNTFTRSPNS